MPLSDNDLLEEVVELRLTAGRRLVVSSPMSADSETMRTVTGSVLLICLVAFGEGWSRLGRPRAAAAQDSRVERLARKAASWST